MLEAVAVVELLRPLHDRDQRVPEVPDQLVDEVRRRDEVGIDHAHELAARLPEGVVQIARLGVSVLVPADVLRTEAHAERAHPLAIAVVEHVGGVRVAHGDRRRDRRREHRIWLVVGRDVEVHPTAREHLAAGGRADIPDHQQ